MTETSHTASALAARIRAAAQRSRPDPFVEVAQHHRRHGVGTRDREEPTRLLASLDECSAKWAAISRNTPVRRCNLDLNGAAWLALGMGDVVDLGRA